jgi:hypothetical protein
VRELERRHRRRGDHAAVLDHGLRAVVGAAAVAARRQEPAVVAGVLVVVEHAPARARPNVAPQIAVTGAPGRDERGDLGSQPARVSST